MSHHLSDDDVEQLLTRQGSPTGELAALRRDLDAYRSEMTAAPVVPSQRLAELMAAGGVTATEVPARTSRRGRAAVATGVTVFVIGGLGALGQLPAAAQDVFDRVARVLGVADGGHPAPEPVSVPAAHIGGNAGGGRSSDGHRTGAIGEHRTADGRHHTDAPRDHSEPEGSRSHTSGAGGPSAPTDGTGGAGGAGQPATPQTPPSPGGGTDDEHPSGGDGGQRSHDGGHGDDDGSGPAGDDSDSSGDSSDSGSDDHAGDGSDDQSGDSSDDSADDGSDDDSDAGPEDPAAGGDDGADLPGEPGWDDGGSGSGAER